MPEKNVNIANSMANREFCLSDQVRHRSVGEDGVLVHLQNGRVIVVNEVGLYIIQLLQNPITAVMMVESISAEFDVSLLQAESDLSSFLSELDQENILKIVEQVGF